MRRESPRDGSSFWRRRTGWFFRPSRRRSARRWLCDSFFLGRANYFFTGDLGSEYLFLENYLLADHFDHLLDGMLAMCYPADFLNGQFIPNWAMRLMIELDDFKKRGGDTSFIESFRPKLVKLIEYLKTFRNSDRLLEKLPSWVFVEWSQANKLVQDVNYPSNMTWAEVLDAMNRLYDMPELSNEAQAVRETVRQPPCLVCFPSRYSTEKRQAVAALFSPAKRDVSKNRLPSAKLNASLKG